MKVIAVLNQKGGSGKTTIATHLARALQLDGADVLLVDSDPQGSARDWAAVREDQPVPVVGIDRPTIERDLKSVARKDYVVIDGAPQAADFVLIPVQPSPYDIWATADLVSWSSSASRSRTGNYRRRSLCRVRSRAPVLAGKLPRRWPTTGCPFLMPASRSA